MEILSNDWWNYIISTYTVTIGLISSLLITIMKLLAVLHPSEKTNSVVGLLQGWIFGFPGANKWDGETDRRK
jgi:hypothetical protein